MVLSENTYIDGDSQQSLTKHQVRQFLVDTFHQEFASMTPKEIGILTSKIAVTYRPSQDHYSLFTLKVKSIKKGWSDDQTYINYPLLQKLIPRGFSIVFHHNLYFTTLRRPINNIVQDIVAIIQHPPPDSIVHKPLSQTQYIGSFPKIQWLIDFATKTTQELCGPCQLHTPLHPHVTLAYIHKKNKKETFQEQHSTTKIVIQRLIVDTTLCSAAFGVDVFDRNENIIDVQSQHPHITACLSPGIQPVQTNTFAHKMITDETTHVLPLIPSVVLQGRVAYV